MGQTRKGHAWGIGQFAVALTLMIGILALWRGNSTSPEEILGERPYALIGLGGALLAGWFGHASYPRVYNFKIYALSIGVATISFSTVLVLFVLTESLNTPGVLSATVVISYISYLFVFLVTVVTPEYLNYRMTQRMTAVIIAIIVAWYFLGLGYLPVRRFLAVELGTAFASSGIFYWVFNGTAGGILLLSLITERDSFGIGGIHAGGVALLSTGWLVVSSDIVLQGMVITSLPVFVAFGTLIHWFHRLENRASYDPLLLIYNRSWCERVIQDQSRLDVRPPCTIALVDLDHFKAVNDTHGHEAGDTVLRETAQRIRNIIVPHGSIGRYGGEELMIVLPRHTATEARKLLETVRTSMEENPVTYKNKAIPVTGSIGYAVRVERTQPLEAVLRAADRALYAAKNNGRNQVRAGRLTRRKK